MKEMGNLTITLPTNQEIVIDGIVSISIATNKNARRNEKITTVKIRAPKDFKITRREIIRGSS